MGNVERIQYFLLVCTLIDVQTNLKISKIIGNFFNQLREIRSLIPQKHSQNKRVTGELGEINSLAVPHNVTRWRAWFRQMYYIFCPITSSIHIMSLYPSRVNGNYFPNCVNVCEWALRYDVPDLSHIFFSEQATFTHHGQVNFRNMNYLPANLVNKCNVNFIQRKCVMQNNGPSSHRTTFYRGSLNSKKYVNFQRHELPPMLEDILLQTRRNMCLSVWWVSRS